MYAYPRWVCVAAWFNRVCVQDGDVMALKLSIPGMGLFCSLVQQGVCIHGGDVRCEVVYTRGGFALQPAAWFCHVAVYARLEI